MLLDEARKLKNRTDIYITEEQHINNLEKKINQLEEVIERMQNEINYLEGLIASLGR